MKTLIVIDMQNDFIDGALGTPEAKAIVPNVKKKIKEYVENGYRVIFTKDTHHDDYLETSEGKHLPVKHCIRGTHGWEITDELEHSTDLFTTLEKETFGLLQWDWFFNWFKQDIPGMTEYVDEIELVGLCTDICVISNAMILKATYPEIPIVVDASCCAGVTPESHKNALEAMKMCQIEIRGE